MKLLCIGAGSIGMLFAGKLAAAGADVELVAHSAEQAAELEAHGLTLREMEGTSRNVRLPVKSFERMERMPSCEPDWVFLTVKQKHLTDRLLRAVRASLGTCGKLLCFQNGIGHVERIGTYVEAERIYLAVTTEGAKKLSPREVAHTGSGITWVGPAPAFPAEPETASACRQAAAVEPLIPAEPAKAPIPRDGFAPQAAGSCEKMLVETMHTAGFAASVSNQMKEIVWNKLLINAVINPLTALLRVPNGQLPQSEYGRLLMRKLMEEGEAVARAHGVPVRDNLWEQLLAVCRNTAANASSMLQDIRDGKATEIDWINGALLDIARRHDVPAPTHETVYALVKAAESGGGG